MCSYDMNATATVTCIECNAVYCTECDNVLHKHPKKRHHLRRTLSSPLFPFPSFTDFLADYHKLVLTIFNSGPLHTYCANHLDIVEHLFTFHSLLNDHLEKKVACTICMFQFIYIFLIFRCIVGAHGNFTIHKGQDYSSG
jgi:AMP deaminase